MTNGRLLAEYPGGRQNNRVKGKEKWKQKGQTYVVWRKISAIRG